RTRPAVRPADAQRSAAADRPSRPSPECLRPKARSHLFPEAPSCAAGKSTAAIARRSAYRHRKAPGWPTPRHSGLLPATSPAPAAHARSAADARPGHSRAPPSEIDPGAFTGLGCTGGVTLTLARLSNQIPQAGLQRRAPACVGQTTAGELLGLRGVYLSQADFGKTIKHLRLTWRDALSALQAGSRTIEIATTLLLLGGGQQSENRTIQLLIGRQATTAGNAAGHARNRGAEAPLGRCRRLTAHRRIEGQAATGGDRLQVGLQRCRDGAL